MKTKYNLKNYLLKVRALMHKTKQNKKQNHHQQQQQKLSLKLKPI